jgi:hypothetical protein
MVANIKEAGIGQRWIANIHKSVQRIQIAIKIISVTILMD